MPTPVRPLGRRLSPALIPNAKTSYQPLLKRVLASRLILVCATPLGLITFTLLIPIFDLQRGPPLGVFGHLVAMTLLAISTLVVGAIPSLVLRGRAVSSNETPSPTRAGALTALVSNARAWRTIAYFATSGFGLTLIHVAVINLGEWEDSRLTVLSPTRRNALRFNERFFYLAFFNASLSTLLATRDLLRQRRVLKWSRVNDDSDVVTSPTSSSRILETLLAAFNYKALLSTTLITILHVLFFPFYYHTTRAFALPILRNFPVLSWFTRPLLQGFGRSWTVEVPWSRMIALGFKTSIVWEFVESSLDYWLVKPISISSKSHDPNQVLVSGLQSQDRYSKHHAYIELSTLAASPPAIAAARRTALFTDTRTTPSLWNALFRELLITLGNDYQHLLRRGKPVATAPAPVSQPAPSTQRTFKNPSTPLLRQPILKPSPRSLFDSFSSDSVDVQTPVKAPSSTDRMNIPSVFLPSTPPSNEAKKEAVKPAKPKTTSKSSIVQALMATWNSAMTIVVNWVEGKLPSEWRAREWWTEVNLENVAKACLPEIDLDVAAIKALSHLVAASLTEDTLGVVQHDIPRILEALLSYLGEIEAYKSELESKLPTNIQNNEDDIQAVEASKKVARAIEVLRPLLIALRTGIGLIAMSFGERLSVYKFPAPSARRLQTFVDHL